MMTPPEIVTTESQLNACIHLRVSKDQMREAMSPALAELHSAIQVQQNSQVGPWLTHHFRQPTEKFDFEICVPVAKEISAMGRVYPGTLPATLVARTIYNGPYEALGGAWSEFMTWIASSEFEPATTDLWERYLVGPGAAAHPLNYQTELNRPVRKKS